MLIAAYAVVAVAVLAFGSETPRGQYRRRKKHVGLDLLVCCEVPLPSRGYEASRKSLLHFP